MNRTFLTVVAVLFVLVASAVAAPITIPNAGFEHRGTYDPLAEGQHKYPNPSQENWCYYDSTANGGPARIGNPPLSGLATAAEGDYVVRVVADPRTWVADTSAPNGVATLLTDTFDPSMTYTLTAEVARYVDDSYWAGYLVQLAAGGTKTLGAVVQGNVSGGTVIAEDRNTQPVPLAGGDTNEWATSTVVYTPDPADAGLAGEPLQIRLLTLRKPGDPGGDHGYPDSAQYSQWLTYAAFDDVTLDAAVGGGGPSEAPKVLFIGAGTDPTSGADGAVMTFLEGRYGAENVTYQRASTVNSGDELAFDALIISSTIGSGDGRTKFQNSTTGVLNWEEALVDDDNGEFQMSIVNKPGGKTAIDIVDNTHYITDGFDLGPLTIFDTGTETVAQNGAIATGVQVLAEEDNSNDATLFIAETDAALFGDGSAGKPDIAFGRRGLFPITDSGFNNLNADGLELFGRTVDWIAGVDSAAAAVPEPSTFVLAALGLLGLGWYGRRSRRQA